MQAKHKVKGKKTMKLQELREKTLDELKQEVLENKKKLMELRIDKSLNKLENTASIANTKRLIAQIKTVITEKETEVKNA